MKVFFRKSTLAFAALCFVFISKFVYSQELHIVAGGSMSVSSGDVLSVNNNLSVNATGSLTIYSNATHSGSLVVTGTATGNITYKRYLQDLKWYLVSAPVVGQSVPAFVANAENALKRSRGMYAIGYYKSSNASGLRWVYHHNTPTTQNQETLTDFVNGQGYISSRTSAGNLTFTGAMATSDVTVSLENTTTNHHWFSVGNPFPSFLPANNNAAATNLISQNTNTFHPSYVGLYFWNGTEYKVVNHAFPSVHLKPGQAFIINTKSGNEQFTFSRNLQSHQAETNKFYRNAPTPNILVTLSDGKESKTTELKFYDNATTGLDPGYDAAAFIDGKPHFSLNTHLVKESQGIDFMLQCLPNNAYETLVIPLSVYAKANKTITFSAATKHLPQGAGAYLEDTVTKRFVNITDTEHTLTLNSTQNGIGRFYLHTSDRTLHTDDFLDISSVNIYKTEGNMLRIEGLKEQGKASVHLYDILGKKIMTQSFKTQRVKDIPLPASLKTGIYLVNIQSEKGQFTKKIIMG